MMSKMPPMILIVDDLLENIQLLTCILHREGYRISFATSGVGLPEIAGDLRPDLILLDIEMPGIKGYEVCRRLKRGKETREIPVIFISAHWRMPEDVVKGFKVGASDYITRPFSRAELLARLRNNLALKFRTGELRNACDELERRVRERTAELERINLRLALENKERIRTEQELRRHQMKLRSLTVELTLMEERDRREIASDIHDSVVQSLAMIKIDLGRLKRSVKNADHVAAIDGIIRNTREIIKETRELSYELSSPILDELGLAAAVKHHIEDIAERHGLTIDFHCTADIKILDDPTQIHLFRSIRELLFNVVKHAHAAHVDICITRNGDRITVVVEDDGVGFDAAENRFSAEGGGFGLFSIRERLCHLGGEFVITASPGSGTRVVLSAPVKSESVFSCRV
ncbi:ATP-binding response regulator [Desulfococcus sp.]|uniref:ATP-binding response regulator n=1 Tax=Desulfococcus sp. TaxID=2025834 RepID=UPI003D0C8C33